MGALACTPTGESPDAPSRPRVGANLLPGERLLAFAQWPVAGSSLTVYASGHLDYRTHAPRGLAGAHDPLGRRDFRVSEASMNDVWALMRLLAPPGRDAADRVYATDGGILYVPTPRRVAEPAVTFSEVPEGVASAFDVVESLRARAEAGADPFVFGANRSVSPLVVHTQHREAHTRELSVFDNGAVEIRHVPTSRRSAAESWAVSGRARSGTMVELQRLVADFDDAPVAACGPTEGCAHEFITARTRRHDAEARGAATRALVEGVSRLVEGLDPP